MRIISKKNHCIWLGRSLGTWNDFGAVVLLEISRHSGDSPVAWRRYGGRGGHGVGPHLYRGGPRVGSWALGLAHGSID
jgi:hypothetical protein